MNELEALDSVKQGKTEAFADIYDLYADRIYAFVYARVSHRETAEDLTSTIFLKALQHIGSFKSGSLQAWLYTIARHTVIDHYRTTKGTSDLEAAYGMTDGTDVAAAVERRDLMERIQELMKKLPPEYREIVTLRVWDDLPYKDIARIVGKSEGAVKMTFSRSVSFLRTFEAMLTLLLTFLFTRHG